MHITERHMQLAADLIFMNATHATFALETRSKTLCVPMTQQMSLTHDHKLTEITGLTLHCSGENRDDVKFERIQT